MSETTGQLEKALANPNDYWLEWVEPVQGLDAKLKEVTATEVNRMTVQDGIAVSRRMMPPGHQETDLDLLVDFIVVRWATIVPKPPEPSIQDQVMQAYVETSTADDAKREVALIEEALKHGQTKLEAPGTPDAPQPGSAETDRTVPTNVGVDPARVQSVSESVVVLRPGVLPPGHPARAYPLADGTDAHGIPSHAPADGG